MAGADALCPQAKISGYYTPGTFQQYCIGPVKYVQPRCLSFVRKSPADDHFLLMFSYLTPIPEELRSADAAVSAVCNRLLVAPRVD